MALEIRWAGVGATIDGLAGTEDPGSALNLETDPEPERCTPVAGAGVEPLAPPRPASLVSAMVRHACKRALWSFASCTALAAASRPVTSLRPGNGFLNRSEASSRAFSNSSH